MKVGIMQPYFFPYLAYWQLINLVDKYVVYDDVTYIKGGWINRNNILINNVASLITLPLDNASSFKNINEIEIIKNQNDKNKILKSIILAYSKAPYFNIIMPKIENLILNSDKISNLNYNSIIEINKYLGINTEILLSSELNKNNELKAQDKVISICKLLCADTYINAIGGRELYSNTDFKYENIKLCFLKMNDVQYKQFNDKFIANLSIIDILMFNSVENIKILLNKCSLI